MSIEMLALIIYVSGFIVALFVAGVFLAVLSAFIIYYLPETGLAKWLASIWLDPIESSDQACENIKVGSCITPKGDKNGTN